MGRFAPGAAAGLVAHSLEAGKPEMAWRCALPLTLANPLVFVTPWGEAFPGLEATRPKDYARAVEAALGETA